VALNEPTDIMEARVDRWRREGLEKLKADAIEARAVLGAEFTAAEWLDELQAMGFRPVAIVSRTQALRFVEFVPARDSKHDRRRYRLLSVWAMVHREWTQAEIIGRGLLFVKSNSGGYGAIRQVGFSMPAVKPGRAMSRLLPSTF
jgi:hypothetical protein